MHETEDLSPAVAAAIVSVAADAIISVDEQQRIIHFNRGAELIFGYVADEVVGNQLDILIPPRFVTAHGQHIRDFAASPVMARRMGERQAVSGIRKGGEEFPADASILKTQTPKGWLFTVLLRDVTDRKRAEEEQRRLLEEARRANRMRDEVLAAVSHDLRNPLSVVRMCVSTLLAEPSPTPAAGELLSGISQSVDWMERLIQDLLDVASIEAGRLRVERQDVPADELAEEARAMASSLAANTGLVVTSAIEPDLLRVSADRERVLQVFANLVGNAAKFTARGGRITIGARNDDTSVRFWVADTGPGIAEDEIEHLFQRYWQHHRSAVQRGTGLGLAISRGIVEAHGGRIWVETLVGQGSTFHFTLPSARPSIATVGNLPTSRREVPPR